MIRCAALEAGFVNAVLNVVGHGLAWNVEDRRLVHVIPEAGHTIGNKFLVEIAPPLARALTGEVREYGRPGPYGAHKNRAVRIFNEDPRLSQCRTERSP